MDTQVTLEAAASGTRSLPPLRRLWIILQPDRGDLISVIAFAFAIGGLLLATPIAVQALVNFVAFGGAQTPILILSLLLFCGLGLAAVLGGVQTWIVEILQRRVFVRTVGDLARRLPRVDPRTQELFYGPELVNRFFDVVTVQKMTSFLLLDGLGVLLGVVIGMVVLAFYHPLLLAFDILIVVSILTILFVLGRSGVRTAVAESKAKYDVASWLEEIARNHVTFREPRAQAHIVGQLDTLTNKYLTARKTHFNVLFRQIVGALLLQVIASVALLSIGGLLVVRGELTLGQLVAAELIVTYVVGSVAKMGKHIEAFYDLMGATDKLGKLLDVPLESSGDDSWTRPTDSAGSALAIEDLTITLRSGKQVLRSLTMEVSPGERVALSCGGSTSTTLLETVYGLRRVEHGLVKVDGLDLRSIDLQALRERTSLAGPIEIFEGTLRDNVTAGHPVPTETLYDALRRTDLLDELLALPQGLDTPLTAFGSPLSKGQLQRLMLARAICEEPTLLMVDGLLDALSDSEAQKVLEALLAPTNPWTLVVATRAPHVLARFNRVVPLNAAPSPALELTR